VAADGVASGAPLRAPAAATAAFLAGFGCMAAELAAVRLLAPHFGDSAYVWTNVIGVILAAMAAGAYLGGRLATHGDPRRAAARLALVAGPWIAASPWASGAIGGWLLPADLPLDAAMPAMVRGSLVATLLLFAPPMAAVGALSPLLVTAVVRGGGAVGAASGGMAAAGTVGSLLGTFLATHWLVPAFGCRAAMAVAGGALAAAGLLLLARRSGVGAVAALAVCAVAFGAPRGPLRSALPGERLVAEVESRMQYLQVVRSDGEPARTRLCINEGLDSFHSLAIEGSCFSGGAYYDWHALAPLLAGGGERPAGLRVVSIGDAAGTLRRVYAAVHPGATVDAVDVDAATMALGDAHFPGPKAEGGRYVLDGRVFLARSTATWDVIHVDAYAHQVYVPAHLASVEFFRAARARLRPGGVVACNVGALRRDDPVLARVGASMAAVFGHARAMLVPNSRNALLVARAGEPPAVARLVDFRFGGERFAAAADDDAWRRIVATAAGAAWFDCVAAQPVEPLADDRPELDRLLAASYLEVRDAGGALELVGKSQPAAAELAAYEARQRLDWPGVLAAVGGSAAATSYLRELAGDARWSLRELRAAAAEYDAALQLAEDPATKDRLAGKRQAVAEEAAPVERAEQLAARNGWLQLAAVSLAACAILALSRISG
jgi:spermidine synthase